MRAPLAKVFQEEGLVALLLHKEFGQTSINTLYAFLPSKE